MYQFLAQVKSEFHYFSMILSFLAKVKRSYGDLCRSWSLNPQEIKLITASGANSKASAHFGLHLI